MLGKRWSGGKKKTSFDLTLHINRFYESPLMPDKPALRNPVNSLTSTAHVALKIGRITNGSSYIGDFSVLV